MEHWNVEIKTKYLRQSVSAFILGVIILVLVPYIHIGLLYRKIWVPDKTPIERNSCSCSCFDTVMRGSYEIAGKARYKHVYINATWQTLCIWLFTVFFFLIAYEALKYLVSLFNKSSIRWSMFVAFLFNILVSGLGRQAYGAKRVNNGCVPMSLRCLLVLSRQLIVGQQCISRVRDLVTKWVGCRYPNYYAWWSFLNYFNEDFYPLFNNQMWFALTEAVSTTLIVHLCDVRKHVLPWKLLPIICIALTHLKVASFDQLLYQLFMERGKTYRKTRNFGLLSSDLFLLIVSTRQLQNYAKTHGMRFKDVYSNRTLVTCAFIIIVTALVGQSL